MDKPIKNVIQYSDHEAMSAAAAEQIVEIINDTVDDKGSFAMALAGGGTPRRVYDLLATKYHDDIPWNSVHIFWGDERFVPHNHPDSNFLMVYDMLISHIPIPQDNIHGVPTDAYSPEHAAKTYEKTIRRFFVEQDLPSFDLIILGIGTDGHTASLFPGDSSLHKNTQLVMTVPAPLLSPHVPRITFTLPLINNATNILFIVSGDKKNAIVYDIINEKSSSIDKYPAAMVNNKKGPIWFLG